MSEPHEPHEHYGDLRINFERAPLPPESPRHTAFWIFACRCGHVQALPEENFAQLSEEDRALLTAAIRSITSKHRG